MWAMTHSGQPLKPLKQQQAARDWPLFFFSSESEWKERKPHFPSNDSIMTNKACLWAFKCWVIMCQAPDTCNLMPSLKIVCIFNCCVWADAFVIAGTRWPQRIKVRKVFLWFSCSLNWATSCRQMFNWCKIEPLIHLLNYNLNIHFGFTPLLTALEARAVWPGSINMV